MKVVKLMEKPKESQSLKKEQEKKKLEEQEKKKQEEEQQKAVEEYTQRVAVLQNQGVYREAKLAIDQERNNILAELGQKILDSQKQTNDLLTKILKKLKEKS